MSGLRASIRCATPFLEIDLDVADGETCAILGPNGSGKSTTLAVLAGLRRTDDSTVDYDGRSLQDGKSFVPPHRRSVVLLAQQPRLFPHMSVARNVAFGPESAGLSRKEVAARTERWLAAVGVAEFADRSPKQLSGGQSQRVAIARALATEPDVLLLDEPFAALDVDVAQQMRTLLRSLITERKGCTVLVTHDLVDAVALADDVVIIEHGRVVGRGPTREVLRRPETAFAAALTGLNMFVGTFQAPATVIGVDGGSVTGVSADASRPGVGAVATFSPRAVALYLDAPQGSPRTVLSGTVSEVMPQGDHAIVRCDVAGQVISAEVTWGAVGDLALGAGREVYLVIKANEVRVYEATSSAEPSDVDSAPDSASSPDSA
ncbi:ABC transporter ATP-binding protein [Gordonia sp. w5E2]|uniref:ABC transporter n=1 Tax=Gordonia jacobaea TaxID=122202 RepID=A0ABR5I8H9_9ACTN|nr:MULTISPECIES: ABC transporter ATP-binding protein [Gordonia]KNA89886.1 ABC transporter [Gordonia jacobaea]